MLIKGAAMNIADNDGRFPVDIANEIKTDVIKEEILKILVRIDPLINHHHRIIRDPYSVNIISSTIL